MRRRPLLLLILLIAAVGCSAGSSRLVVAAGTTLVDSGLIDGIAARYEHANPGVEIAVLGDATAKVLELARNGAADVTITHAPDLEHVFLDDGLAAADAVVFSSRFVLAGPPGPRSEALAGLEGSAALARIAREGWTFVSRADGSGTYLSERHLWAEAGIDPSDSPWYLETGQGMGLTLQVADQRGAFVLAELGTYLVARPTLELVDVGIVDPPDNPYRAMAVAGSDAEDEAVRFVDWLSSPDGEEAVLDTQRAMFDRPVYVPAG
jgi:tungstate transport system substrate-binding protein